MNNSHILSHNLRETKILLVEDDPMDQILITRAIKRLMDPVEVITVSTRTDFVRHLLEFVPDLIISDYHLGPFNGLEVLILLRHTFPKVPFIILSGESDPDLIQSWYDQGISACVSKNRLDTLPAVIEEAQIRSQDYASQLTRVRIMHSLREQINQIAGLEQTARSLEGGVYEKSMDETVRNFCETGIMMEDLYGRLKKSSPIH